MKISVEQLTFKYLKSRKNILDGIDLEIETGVFGLIGENGAGKTTLLKILSTLIPVKKGNVKTDNWEWGKDNIAIRKKIGYLPQKFEFFEKLSVYEFLYYICLNKGMEKSEIRESIENWLEQFNLIEKIDEKIYSLSGGMKQRVAIIQALIGSPDIIILDEPTVGLDPIERLRFKNIINSIQEGKIIIISTHIISDVSTLCNNIGIMKSGEVLFCGAVDKLINDAKGKVNSIYIDNKESIPKGLIKNVISINRLDGRLELRYISEIVDENECEPNLEDAYFYKMQERAIENERND